jgi:hypothetical protein
MCYSGRSIFDRKRVYAMGDLNIRPYGLVMHWLIAMLWMEMPCDIPSSIIRTTVGTTKWRSYPYGYKELLL